MVTVTSIESVISRPPFYEGAYIAAVQGEEYLVMTDHRVRIVRLSDDGVRIFDATQELRTVMVNDLAEAGSESMGFRIPSGRVSDVKRVPVSFGSVCGFPSLSCPDGSAVFTATVKSAPVVVVSPTEDSVVVGKVLESGKWVGRDGWSVFYPSPVGLGTWKRWSVTK